MAIKLKCDGCGKLIVVDAAFAGGVCRCPYCKATVNVDANTIDAAVDERPDEPAAQADEQAVAVPRAGTPRKKGPPPAVIALIVIAAVLVAAGVAAVIMFSGGKPGSPESPGAGDRSGRNTVEPAPSTPEYVTPIDPFVASGPSVVAGDIKVQSPVVYCLDGGASMADQYEAAVNIARVSVASLPASDKFWLLTAIDRDNDAAIAGEYLPAGEAGAKSVADYSQKPIPIGGATKLDRVVKTAISLDPKPKTLVLMIGNKNVEPILEIAKQLKSAGVRLVVVELDSSDALAANLKKVEEAGATVRCYDTRTLMGIFESMPR